LTALPIAPDQLSTCSNAGETFSKNSTAPSAASTELLRRTLLTSAIASCTRAIAGCERQPKALRRKRAANCQRCLSAVTI
jgi:hypothetical protein